MQLRLVSPAIIFWVIVASASLHMSVAADAPRRVEISAKRFSFSPEEVSLKQGVPVVLVLSSEDVEHGLKFKELNLNIKFKKGTPIETTFTPQEAGDFVGQCSVFCGAGHGSMKMTIHVTK